MATVGVVVGRFQIDTLHKAHRTLLLEASGQNDHLIVVVGDSGDVKITPRNPLPAEMRIEMIEDFFKEWGDWNVIVEPLRDHPDDDVWSQNLDALISRFVAEDDTVTLYGGRDSCLSVYTGKYNTQTFTHSDLVSASELRENIAKSDWHNADFRAGVIWAAYNKWPVPYPVVDVAICNNSFEKILLGRKAHESKWRLIGGFVDVQDSSYETAARREAKEEASVSLNSLNYLGSFPIDDWRYRREVDGLITSLWLGTTSDEGKAADDIAELRWFWIGPLMHNMSEVNESHHEILGVALNYIFFQYLNVNDGFQNPNYFAEGPH